ncbi:hypothetical protein HRG_010394 [Hirsutella rhossiliensis]|uniref:Uncharacterized protein n=1 Tax=Hirsutella rhossiliensis TaxID=111463 RepID=A0A9P8MT46_9HYPO|nr:uncharacterized protein HRG_10394 [Hirsutella rhossiliensis]KAH0958707.1 hypothetical protein HRG_10394 [Hirsutella rhossiliensis]
MVLAEHSQTGLCTSGLRKRHAPSAWRETEHDEDGYSHKKQKLNHPAFPPPRFWDRLSVIPLTRRALQESQRRISRSACGQEETRNCYGRAPRHHIHIINADCFVEQLSPACLRRLKRSARQGGPDLWDTRGYRIPAEAHVEMSSSQFSSRRRKRGSQSPTRRSSNSPSKSSATPNTTSTKSTGPYDRAFQQHLIDHDVLPHGYEYPDGRLPPEPENIAEIRQILAEPRRSLSPSQFTGDDFRKFERADTHAAKERDVIATVIPVLEGNTGDRKCVAGQVPFTNFDHLTDGSLVPGNPDLYYGAGPEQLERTIRRELSNLIIPSTQHDLPIVPNFCLEVKGPDGTLSVASRQASYHGALSARSIDRLRSYGHVEPRFDNRAYAITSIYYGGTLKMYTAHPIPPSAPDGRPGFVMTQIKTWGLTGDADIFRQGAAAYRNLRDWAKEQRDNAIKEANERLFRYTRASPLQDTEGLASSFTSETSAADTVVTSQTTVLHPDSNVQTTYESDSSDDPLSLDFQPLEPPAKRTKSQSPQKKA